jgi:hypothetical protein
MAVLHYYFDGMLVELEYEVLYSMSYWGPIDTVLRVASFAAMATQTNQLAMRYGTVSLDESNDEGFDKSAQTILQLCNPHCLENIIEIFL